MKFRKSLASAAAAATLLAAGCSSSSKSTSPPDTTNTGSSGSTSATSVTSSGSSKTFTIGVLSDLTGAASADNTYVPQAIKAGIGVAATEGYKIKFVEADTQSTTTGTLAAAQKLVEQDHVFAVIALSDLTFAAAPFLASKHIPVIGGAVDGNEWTTDSNMFSVFGTPDYTKVVTTYGTFFKQLGITKVGAIGYSGVPSSADSAESVPIAAQHAGLQVGYVNAQFPLGSTNVGPVVLGIKNSQTEGVVLEIQQDSGFAITSGLKAQGYPAKAAVFGAGYGSDLLDAGPAAVQEAAGGYFELSYEPIEVNDAATQKFVNALKTYANFDQVPGLAIYLGYISVDAVVAGLKAAGPDPTQTSFINVMLGITNYDAAGLWGGHTISFAMNARGTGGPGADNCLWFTTFSNGSFHLVSGADPICGTVIPGKTVG